MVRADEWQRAFRGYARDGDFARSGACLIDDFDQGVEDRRRLRRVLLLEGVTAHGLLPADLCPVILASEQASAERRPSDAGPPRRIGVEACQRYPEPEYKPDG